MTSHPRSLSTIQNADIGLPRWVTRQNAQSAENTRFFAGAAVMKLDLMLQGADKGFPAALLSDRLALGAALACLKFEGRQDTEQALRDAVCLARDDEALGPGGEAFAFWRRGARIDLRSGDWADRLVRLLPERQRETVVMADLIAGGADSLLGWVAEVVERALKTHPRQEAMALMLGDCVLARSLGWPHPVPLLAAHMTRRDLRAMSIRQQDASEVVGCAMVNGSDTALRLGDQLNRQASRLREMEPKLRNRSASQAIEVFLTHDAVSPSGMLSPVIRGTATSMTDRAARRLCDRLVDLGVVRELTGRATFRLYGL